MLKKKIQCLIREENPSLHMHFILYSKDSHSSCEVYVG